MLRTCQQRQKGCLCKETDEIIWTHEEETFNRNEVLKNNDKDIWATTKMALMLRIMKRLFKIIGHIVKKKSIEKWIERTILRSYEQR